MNPVRHALFDMLAERIAELEGEGLTMVAIDGVDAAGKTTFADALASHLEQQGKIVVRTGIDAFHNPRAVRYARGKDSAEGYFRDAFNLGGLRTSLLFPARIGMPFLTALFDYRTDKRVAVNPLIVPLPAVLIFDGVFLHRDELRDEWDLTVYLDVPFEISFARMAKRDGTSPDPDAESNRRYRGGQELYFKDANPKRSADVLIDYADTEHPRVVRS